LAKDRQQLAQQGRHFGTPQFMRWRRVLAVIGLGLVVALAAGLLWLRSLFQAPGATLVPSVAARLGARSILAVFPHPDDEIKAAGLIADATSRGIEVRMITLAEGDRGEAGSAYPRSELPRIREAEVRKSGAALGVREQEVWQYSDGTLSSVEPELVRRLGERIAAWHPEALLTFDPEGGFTAHPDHLATGRAVTAAFCNAKGSEAPRWLIYTLAPRPVARKLGGKRGRLVAEREPAPELRIAVNPKIKVRAWKIHASQSDYVRRFAHMPPSILYRFFLTQEFYSVRGRDQCGGER
jgi:LmbE family N-acetylglucosaminyl deacetylase